MSLKKDLKSDDGVSRISRKNPHIKNKPPIDIITCATVIHLIKEKLNLIKA